MDNKLIDLYLEYASSEEAYAVLFVKKYLEAADHKWVDILKTIDSCHFDMTNLEFKAVYCELFDRKMTPHYPDKKDFKTEEEDYRIACRAVTWETAHKDIENQRSSGIKGPKYVIEGIKYNTNRGKSYFVDSAPPEIRALEKNLNDRTDPLWADALKFARHEKWIFKVRSIRKVDVDEL